jgi:hypothetical protein
MISESCSMHDENKDSIVHFVLKPQEKSLPGRSTFR